MNAQSLLYGPIDIELDSLSRSPTGFFDRVAEGQSKPASGRKHNDSIALALVARDLATVLANHAGLLPVFFQQPAFFSRRIYADDGMPGGKNKLCLTRIALEETGVACCESKSGFVIQGNEQLPS
ncbi:hypothetical protein [Cohnella fermenti]|uniref:hypothetical protein n=1 Tax=Cohnella fermenti TaxID=2565925 RepID=UPI001454CC35|nr:hypothetical protein [Cohnella fermenti]